MRALKANPDNANALLLRAKAFYQLGQVEGALNHLKEALRYDPDHKLCKEEWKVFFTLYLNVHLLVQRLKNLDKWTKAAESEFNQDKFQEAIDHYALAIQTASDNMNLLPFFYLSQCKAYIKV